MKRRTQIIQDYTVKNLSPKENINECFGPFAHLSAILLSLRRPLYLNGGKSDYLGIFQLKVASATSRVASNGFSATRPCIVIYMSSESISP